MDLKCLPITIVAVLLVCTGTAFGASCDPNPCGEGAQCQSMSTIAVCLCPPGTTGNPFESCTASTMSTTSSSTSSSTTESTSTSTLSPSTPSTTYTTTTSTSSRPAPMTEATMRFTPELAMSTAQESRNSHTYTTPGHRSNPPGTEEYGYRTSYGQDSYRHRTSPFYNPYNEPIRGENRFSYHQQSNSPSASQSSHTTLIMTMADRSPHRNRDRDSYHQESGTQDYTRRVVSVPDVNYDRVYDERYASTSKDLVKDPMGVYQTCKNMNGILVCADTADQHEQMDPSRDSMHKSGASSDSYLYQSRDNDYRPRPSPHSSSSGSYHGMDRDREQEDRYRTSSSATSYHQHQDNNRNRNKYRDEIPNAYSGSRPMNAVPSNARNPGEILHEFIIKTQDPSDYRSSSSGSSNPNSRPYNQQSESITPGAADPDLCRKYCGENAICRQIRGRPICGCPEGYTGDASVRCELAEDQFRMKNRCHKHIDCSDKEICEDSQCIDPCSIGTQPSEDRNELRSSMNYRRSKQSNFYDAPRRGEFSPSLFESKRTRKNFCGPNTKCHVIDHTPLCGCLDGFTGNPYIRCVRSG